MTLEGDILARMAELDPQMVRLQLARILSSAGFHQAESLSRFLQFIVDENLAGRSGDLKEYSIGVQVFGRGDSFDPKTDTIVRVQARRLRKKLEDYYVGDGLADPVLMDLPKGGYVPVFTLRPGPMNDGAEKPRPKTAFLRWTAALVAVIFGGFGAWSWLGRSEQRAISSIAVLPFENLSHNPSDEWFSDGMTDALITELSHVQSLKVISRTSVLRYKGGTTPLTKIAKELGADAIVEGSALRVGDRVRVTAQLIAASMDTHLWSNNFDEDMKDVLALHREVARRIVDQVGAAVTRAEGQRLHERPNSENPQAVAAYMRGLYLLNRNGDLRSALDLAREAVRTDDTLARAHALVASVLLTQASYHQIPHSAVLPEAHAELDRAMALDPDLPMTLTQLGTEYFEAEHDWVRGEQALRKAFERDPSTGANYAYLLAAQGRKREAVEAADKSLVYDPANPLNLTDVAHIHLLVRQYEPAVELLRKALDLSPDFTYARFYFPLALRLAGKPDEAFQAWISHPDGGKALAPHLDEFREAYRGEGWPGVWKLYLRVAPATSLNARLRAELFLNHKAEALSLLEELERQADTWLVQLEDPMYDPLRKEPRFRAILKRVGYAQAMWQ